MLIALAAVACAAGPVSATAAEPGFDYSKQANTRSQPRYETQTDKLLLAMADGRKVYIEVIRPTEPGRYGVIMEASPYHGTLYDRTGTRILPLPRGANGKPLGLAGYFAPRGYAIVMMDMRGTGKSQGCLDHLGPADASDLKRVVEWAASQPWSNGRVGIVGHSYVGSTPSVAAAQNPKGLVTIVPSAGLAAMYDHMFHAGVPWYLQWAGPVEAYEQLALQADLPPQLSPATQASGNGGTGDNFGNDPHETGCGMQTSAALTGESLLSGQEVYWHRQRDWTSGVAAWDGSVFMVHGVNDDAARVKAMDWFYDRSHNPTDKTWIGQWDHGIGCCPTRRGMQWTYALHAWFDKQLLKRDVATGPNVEVFMNDEPTDSTGIVGQAEVLTAPSWPPLTEKVTFHAQPGRMLGTEPPPSGDERTFAGNADGWLRGRDRAARVEYVSDPLPEDLVIVGIPKLQVALSQSSPRTHIIANLVQQDIDGLRRRIGNCAINPELRNGLHTITPVVPGQRMTIFPPCWTSAHHLRAGSQLVLQVMTSDGEHVPTFATDPKVTVFTGPDATKVTLPVVSDPQLQGDTADTWSEPDPSATG